MWAGYEITLIDYACFVCEEWMSRGYKDTCKGKILDLLGQNPEWLIQEELPSWLTEEFASNHRSVLLGKAKETKDKAWLEFSSSEDILDYKLAQKHGKAVEVWKWYQQWSWSETPAVRNEDGKWPYLWPEVA